MVKVQPDGRQNSWVSTISKGMILDRDNLKQIAHITDSREDWHAYKVMRNKVTESIRRDKKNYFDKLFKDADEKKDAKSLFRITREKLGWTTGGPPTALVHEGELLSKPREVAECLSKYFENKIRKLKSDILDITLDPCETLRESNRKWEGAYSRQEFNLRKVSILEIIKIIGSLSSSTTMGHDLLDPLSLKLVIKTLAKPVQHVVNTSITTMKYCNKWKLGKLLPLFKGGDEDKFSSKAYRPISILPVISKITEKAVHKQVLNFMKVSKQFNMNLHGYRELHSTTTAALQLTDYIMNAADREQVANSMMLDQSAAFDCVNAVILDRKLELYKLSENTRKWFRSYLQSRSQYVCIGAATSSIRTVTSGIPQGSILGPILYSIYTNELPQLVK